MAQDDTARLDAIKRKPAAMRIDYLDLEGEGHRKRLADEDLRRLIGRAIERAIDLAKLEKKAVAHAMGYADGSALARWISGVETPQFAKLFGVVALRRALVIALAEIADGVDVQTTITIRRAG
jgi:hypothetical protein